MPTSAKLKKQASELFSGSLLRSVNAKIEAKAEARPASRPDTIRSSSIATGWAGNRLFKRLGVGEYQGRVGLIWNGMDSFVFRPDPKEPFSYTTSDKFKFPKLKITLGLMDTDGGSIPHALRGLAKFSSWGFAPAYLVHDWIFTAYKCSFRPVDTWAFDDTAEVLAEAIKTLMVDGFTNYDGQQIVLPKAEDTLYLIYQAVASSIARGVYEDKSTVVCRPQ